MAQVQLPDGRLYGMDNFKLRILDFFKDAILHHNTSAVMLYDGVSGSGKSTQAIQDGFYCDMSASGFGMHKIYFTPDDFLDGLASAEPFSFHLFDEAMVLSNRATMSRLNQTIVKAMSMIRSKKIIVAFCINSVFDLDRNLALSRANCLFHCFGSSLIDRGKFMAFFKGKDGQDRLKQLYLYGKKFYQYNKPRANFLGKFSKRFLVDADDYEAKKQAGVTEAIQNSRATPDREWMYHLIYKLRHIKGMSTEEIAQMANVTDRNIRKILEKAVQIEGLRAL